MLSILLLLILIFLVFVFYIKDNKDIISPPFILTLVFVFSTIVMIINTNNWNVNLHINTVLLILFSICCFEFGYSWNKKKKSISSRKLCSNLIIEPKVLHINKIFMILIFTSLIITGILYYDERVRLAATLGVDGNLIEIAAAARHAEYYTEESMSDFVQRLMLFTKCFAYITAYVFVNNLILKKTKHIQFIYIIPFIVYCFFMYISGGRMPFIHNLTFLAILYGVLIYKIKGISTALRIRIIKIVFYVFVTFFIIFIYMGTQSGKITDSIFDSVSVYVGSSINALDIFLQNKIPEEQYFGQETLIPIYSTIRSFGYNIPSDMLRSAREFVSMNGITTNIYTALRRYVRDYGYLGCFCVMFMIGTIYGKIYKFILAKRDKGYLTLIYASIYNWTRVTPRN